MFLFYAYPCAEMKERRGIISWEDFKELTAIVDNGNSPTHNLLIRCFHIAVQSFAEFAGIDSLIENPWPVGKVREFWRKHQGRRLECAVVRGEVEKISDIRAQVRIKDREKDRSVLAFNRYELPISKGDTIFFHWHVITEVEKKP